jgi:hypothetical protein
VQKAVDLKLAPWRTSAQQRANPRTRVFVASLLACALTSALLASCLPLQFSIVTVFLFAGPHNWFELRYFLMRLPVRFGNSRNFFLTAFVGIALLTVTYASLPLLYRFGFWTNEAWSMVIAVWNTLLLVWLGLLVWLRGNQKVGRNWSWVLPIVLALSSLNWMAPEFFSLAIVYIHPLVALWFLDRHLARTRPDWLQAYRRCLCLLPLLLAGMVWQISLTPALADDNGLFWRITQHAGAQLLPNVSSHLLVSVHVFLEMLHYGVWLLALPLVGPVMLSSRQSRNAEVDDARPGNWSLRSVPVARHPRGFPKTVAAVLVFGLFVVGLLWFGFSVDYAKTRDIYFTVAIAHVLAEAPFLMRML